MSRSFQCPVRLESALPPVVPHVFSQMLYLFISSLNQGTKVNGQTWRGYFKASHSITYMPLWSNETMPQPTLGNVLRSLRKLTGSTSCLEFSNIILYHGRGYTTDFQGNQGVMCLWQGMEFNTSALKSHHAYVISHATDEVIQVYGSQSSCRHQAAFRIYIKGR